MKRVITTERLPIKLWLDDIETEALQQARNLANLPFAFKWIAIMPDCHRGYGMPIGGVMAAKDVIVPNAVGVDIGCGMVASKLSINEIDEASVRDVLDRLAAMVPVGFEHHSSPQKWSGFDQAPDIPVVQRELASARRQLGTLGGGNHFMEIQRGDDGRIWLMVHSGSRNFGYKLASEYHRKAKKYTSAKNVELPTTDLAFLPFDSNEGQNYFKAMQFALDFAQASRSAMMKALAQVTSDVTGAKVEREINIHHNYAAVERHFGRDVIVHRKGATKATKGLAGIIPGSMGACSYIVEGLGNPDSFSSCSHGAGRIMGRRKAKRELDLQKEQQKMSGIVHGLYTRKGLDEAPGAYKDIDQVMRDQQDLVKVKVELRPLGVMKG